MNDPINHPNHYANQYPFEVKDLIETILTIYYGPDAYKAYCLGNELKYRLRAGFKGNITEDISKALKYKDFRDKSNQTA